LADSWRWCGSDAVVVGFARADGYGDTGMVGTHSDITAHCATLETALEGQVKKRFRTVLNAAPVAWQR